MLALLRLSLENENRKSIILFKRNSSNISLEKVTLTFLPPVMQHLSNLQDLRTLLKSPTVLCPVHLNHKEFDCYARLETEQSGTVHLYIQATIGEISKPIGMDNIKDLIYGKDRKHHLVFAIPEAKFESFKPHAGQVEEFYV
jgi:hypothetical protein